MKQNILKKKLDSTRQLLNDIGDTYYNVVIHKVKKKGAKVCIKCNTGEKCICIIKTLGDDNEQRTENIWELFQ